MPRVFYIKMPSSATDLFNWLNLMWFGKSIYSPIKLFGRLASQGIEKFQTHVCEPCFKWYRFYDTLILWDGMLQYLDFALINEK